jgi:uncharacterized RDD family membrane protein YckC
MRGSRATRGSNAGRIADANNLLINERRLGGSATTMDKLPPELRRQPLDCTVRLITPERIVLSYPLAGPFRRFMAYLIDQFLIGLLVAGAFLLSMFFALGSAAFLGPALIAYFVLTWGYGAFCEGLFNGQTLGKHWIRIRVLSERGVPITGVQAILRNLIGTVDGLIPFCFLVGLSSMLVSRKFQRMGDLAAGTMVVIEERRLSRGITRIDDPESEGVLAWLPQRIAVGSHVARALSDYVEVRRRFGPLRRAEMAEPLAAPLRRRFGVPDQASADAVLCAVYHRVFLGE